MTESKTSKATNYRNLIVPLKNVAERYEDIMNHLAEGQMNEATVVAARAVFETLGALWHTPNKCWRSVRDRMHIGLVKDTKNFGNTSVSQGCAVAYFNENPGESAVTFLNCGTGGIKYQVYERKPNGVVTPKSEYKPKDGASPQEFLNNANGIADSLRMAWQRENLKKEIAAASIPEGCTVFAFVTGTIRAVWESGDDTVKAGLEKTVTEFFSADPRIVPHRSGTFFLTQGMEGALETSGTNSMYENLTVASELPKSVRTIAVLGIGRGSVQLTWKSVDRVRQYSMNTTPGMDDTLGLSTLPWRLMPVLREKIETCVDYMGDYGMTTIALKSGCMLYLNSPNGKPLLDLLTSPVHKQRCAVDSRKVAVLKSMTDMMIGFIPLLPALVTEDEYPDLASDIRQGVQQAMETVDRVVIHR